MSRPFGFKHTEETKAKMKSSALARNISQSESYQAMHKWVRRRKKRTGICEQCGAQPTRLFSNHIATDFANISGDYRRDVNDYIELCRACHRQFDRGERRSD